ncbi:hypothetical protein JR316_0001538 [Psilocybe cubensis]|uniref:BTB domain-containing protein n=2 Tax=Psilocybe cubensis TaxID=181762 RepID=A0A8H7Y8U1_PSICU|nr:hypothetical protein JR316_0001538 [Psilocybe cubensis]KAH9487462.1 hypothetical protein JR316_0001538 [Psilocybe cubensis]
MTMTKDLVTENGAATPVEDLWFEDGNLILKAENSLFKIYSGLLAARSSVFRDMLAFPPPAEGNATVSGCPIVTVYDSAKDMGYFLRAVFDTSYFEPPPVQSELPIVEGVLRLSLKYDVQYLRRRALQHLLSTFPTTLEHWKQRDTHRTIPPVDNTPFAAFRLARQFELTWLLPSILYCISSHPFEKTLDKSTWGSEEITLSWPDKRMCILGRQRIIMKQTQNALKMMKHAHTNAVEGCTSEMCAATRQRCAQVLADWDMAGLLDYFEDNADMYYSGFCARCRAAFKDLCASECQDLWDELPSMFDLPNWEVLEGLRRRSLE